MADLAPRTSGLLPVPLLLAAFVLYGLALLVAIWPLRRVRGLGPAVGVAGALLLGNLLFFWRPLLSTDSIPRGGGDLASFFFPLHAYAAERLWQGDLPLWNPRLHGGMPQLANYQTAMLYPPNLLAWLVDHPLSYATLERLAILHYLIASAAAYGLARALGLARGPAVGAGLVFAYSGFLTAHLGHYSMLSTAVWLPLLLLTTRQVALQRSWLWAAATALVVYLIATAGHQQTLLYTLTLTGAWWLFWVGQRLKLWDAAETAGWTRWPPDSPARPALYLADVSRFSIGIGLGLGLAAPALLPAVQLGQRSVRSALSYEQSTEFSLQPVALLHFVLPKVFGSNPTDYWGPFSSGEIWGYVGIATLVLAGLALAARPEPVRVFLGAIVLAALLYALGPATPIQGWAYRFGPLYDLVRAPARGLLFVDLGLALLAGFALHDLSAGLVQRAGGFAALRGALRMSLLGIGALALVVLPIFYSLILGANDLSNRPVIAVDGLNLLLLYLSATAVLLWAALRGVLPGGVLALAAVVLIVVDLFGATATFNPTDRDLVAGFRHPEAVAFLRGRLADEGPFRIDSTTLAWQPDLAATVGLQDAGGLFDPMQLANYRRLYELASADRAAPRYGLLGARFLITDAGSTPPGPNYSEALRTGQGLAVWENQAALPRARLAYAARVVDVEAALAQIARPEYDPRHGVLLDRALPRVDLAGPAGSGSARIVSDQPDEVRVLVETDRAAYLVLADVNYPGWTATVDGRRTAIATADAAFRAVTVPAGTHEVRFRFEPPLFRLGTWVAGASLLGLLAMLGIVATSRLRARAARVATTGAADAQRQAAKRGVRRD